MNNKVIGPEDYAEPRCVLCDAPYGAEQITAVPTGRIVEKLNEYMSRRDYAGAERHLLYWLKEAIVGHDGRGELFIRGELIGHYRKDGKRDEAYENIDAALRLVDELDMGDTISAGTTFINAATAYDAFGDDRKALALFEKARAVYERGGASPELMGGLYNNMALTCAALGRYAEALELYDRAEEQMKLAECGEPELAITCLNRADALSALKGDAAEREINALLDEAYALLDSPKIPRDGYYAFVCEKCAPAFSHYGYFLAAGELEKRAREIYERS